MQRRDRTHAEWPLEAEPDVEQHREAREDDGQHARVGKLAA